MENNDVSYIRTDDNKIINEKCIRWVKKMNECLYVCTKSAGCDIKHGDTHTICNSNSPASYEKLNKNFE